MAMWQKKLIGARIFIPQFGFEKKESLGLLTSVPLEKPVAIEVVNFDRSNIISNIKVTNQSCKEDHFLFNCVLNVLSLHQHITA